MSGITHLSDSQRNKTLRLLREYGAKTRWVYLEANPDELLKRNLDRDTTLSNKRLMDLIYKWQPPLPFEGHEVIVWNENKPNYIPYITSEKDEDSPWLFDKKKIFKI